jgi:type III secretion protein T
MFELLAAYKVSDILWPLVVAAPRLFGFWLGFPMFGQHTVPELVRGGVTLAFALFCWPITAGNMPDPRPSDYQWLFIVPKELLIGYFFGVILGLVVWALESAGTIIDTQTGTNNAAQMDPNAGAPLGPTGVFLRQYAVALLLTSGFFGQYLVLVMQSMVVWPWFKPWPDTQLFTQVFMNSRSALYWGETLRFVVPVMFALLLTELGLGLINRATPSFDVYRLGMPVKSLVAAFVLTITVVFWAEALVQLYREDAAMLMKALGGIAIPR